MQPYRLISFLQRKYLSKCDVSSRSAWIAWEIPDGIVPSITIDHVSLIYRLRVLQVSAILHLEILQYRPYCDLNYWINLKKCFVLFGWRESRIKMEIERVIFLSFSLKVKKLVYVDVFFFFFFRILKVKFQSRFQENLMLTDWIFRTQVYQFPRWEDPVSVSMSATALVLDSNSTWSVFEQSEESGVSRFHLQKVPGFLAEYFTG